MEFREIIERAKARKAEELAAKMLKSPEALGRALVQLNVARRQAKAKKV